MKRLIAIIGAFALLSGTFFLSTSCEKDTRDYELTVIVTIDDTVRVQNAAVRVYADVANSMIDYYYSTNEDGEISQKFDNKVIVEIFAQKGNQYKGCTFAEVDRGQNTVYVDLKVWNDPHNGC